MVIFFHLISAEPRSTLEISMRVRLVLCDLSHLMHLPYLPHVPHNSDDIIYKFQSGAVRINAFLFFFNIYTAFK